MEPGKPGRLAAETGSQIWDHCNERDREHRGALDCRAPRAGDEAGQFSHNRERELLLVAGYNRRHRTGSEILFSISSLLPFCQLSFGSREGRSKDRLETAR